MEIKKQIIKHSSKDFIILTELPIVWLIIGSDDIFNKEVIWPFAINIDCAQLGITQNRNELKFWT